MSPLSDFSFFHFKNLLHPTSNSLVLSYFLVCVCVCVSLCVSVFENKLLFWSSIFCGGVEVGMGFKTQHIGGDERAALMCLFHHVWGKVFCLSAAYCSGTMVLYFLKFVSCTVLIHAAGTIARQEVLSATTRILGRGTAESLVVTQTQRKQDENASW